MATFAAPQWEAQWPQWLGTIHKRLLARKKTRDTEGQAVRSSWGRRFAPPRRLCLASMAIELSQVARLRRGGPVSAVVGPLAREGRLYLNCQATDVILAGDAMRHVAEVHADISDLDVISMSYGLRCGMYVTDNKRPHHLIIAYSHPDTQTRYKMIVKCTAEGRELWVSTFHRLRPRQTRALLSRGKILRNHD